MGAFLFWAFSGRMSGGLPSEITIFQLYDSALIAIRASYEIAITALMALILTFPTWIGKVARDGLTHLRDETEGEQSDGDLTVCLNEYGFDVGVLQVMDGELPPDLPRDMEDDCAFRNELCESNDDV
jgi:hypothetical protein